MRTAEFLNELQMELVDWVLLKIKEDDNFDHFHGVHIDYPAAQLVVYLRARNPLLVSKILAGMRCHPNLLRFEVIVNEGDLTLRDPQPTHDKVLRSPEPEPREPPRPPRLTTPPPKQREFGGDVAGPVRSQPRTPERPTKVPRDLRPSSRRFSQLRHGKGLHG